MKALATRIERLEQDIEDEDDRDGIEFVDGDYEPRIIAIATSKRTYFLKDGESLEELKARVRPSDHDYEYIYDVVD